MSEPTSLVVLVVPENFSTIAVDIVRNAVRKAARGSSGQMGAGPTSQGILALADSARLINLDELEAEALACIEEMDGKSTGPSDLSHSDSWLFGHTFAVGSIKKRLVR